MANEQAQQVKTIEDMTKEELIQVVQAQQQQLQQQNLVITQMANDFVSIKRLSDLALQNVKPRQ